MDAEGTQENLTWQRNLIDIENPAISLYRTFRLVHFRKTLIEGTMALLVPDLWDDPFENLVAQCLITDLQGEKLRDTFLGNIRKPVYGQCWSLLSATAAVGALERM
jgi:hypothetical protein